MNHNPIRIPLRRLLRSLSTSLTTLLSTPLPAPLPAPRSGLLSAVFPLSSALVALALALPAAATPTVQELLRTADRWRTGSDALQVETLVATYGRDGQLDKERRYTVFAQPQRRSLVLMRSPAEAGQKVLMLGDEFWLLMPGSQRPMRITPTQKLLGDAAAGDIATLAWADDYAGSAGADAPCPPPDAARRCTPLSLAATRKGLTYARIELWLGAARGEPVAAELYVQSDKLAKRARFVLDAAGTRVDAMVLQDQLGSGKETRVRYLSRTPKAVPEAWLNPMFLARSPVLE